MAIPIATTTGEIRNGKLMLSDRRAFDEVLSTLKTGTQVELEVYRLTATRSTQANRFYWGVVIKALCDLTGHTPAEMHELMKSKFLPKEYGLLSVTGESCEQLTIGGSTRALPPDQFGQYVDGIRNWSSASLGLYIPGPNEAVL